MKKIFFALVALALLVSTSAKAQFSISTEERDLQGTVVIDTVAMVDSLYNPYFSAAKWRAEKLQLRKDRNKMELGATLQVSQTAFDNWESGGTNTFTGRSTFSIKHEYKKETMTVTTGFSARYGVNVIDSEVFKNEDEFQFSWQMAWTINDSWSYGGSVNFRSQFANGYTSITDKTLISTFLSPAYSDVALGFNYKKEGSPFEISLSPATGNMVIVMDDSLSAAGTAGVDAGSHFKSELGPSIRIAFDKKFGKKEMVRYQSNVYSFTNFKSDPIVRWENTLDFSPTKYLTATFYLLSFYDKSAVTPRPEQVQFKYSLSIGLSYSLVK